MRNDTLSALKEYGVKTFGNKKNIEALDRRISENEQVHYISFANMCIVNTLINTKSVIVGAIAITDKNIYIMNAMGSDQEGVYSLNDLSGARYEANGLTGAQFNLTFNDMIISFDASYKKDLARRLYDAIRKMGDLDDSGQKLPNT